GTCERVGATNDIPPNRRLHLVLAPYNGAAGVGHLGRVLRRPVLPRSYQWVARFEREVAAVGEGRPDRGERGAYLVILNELLEGMTGHDDQVELPLPADRREVAEDPLDVRPRTRLVEH